MAGSKKTKAKWNPWAICTVRVGRDSPNFEKCVTDVKKSISKMKPMRIKKMKF